jgi:hypothetical protein
MVKVDEAGKVTLIQLVGNPVPAGQFKKTDLNVLWYCVPSIQSRRYGIFEEVLNFLKIEDFVILCITNDFGDTYYKHLSVKEIKKVSSFEDNPNYKGIQKIRWVESDHWNNYILSEY